MSPIKFREVPSCNAMSNLFSFSNTAIGEELDAHIMQEK